MLGDADQMILGTGQLGAAVGQRQEVRRQPGPSEQEAFQPDLALGVVEPEGADRLAVRVAVEPGARGQPRVHQLLLGRREVGLRIDDRHGRQPIAGASSRTPSRVTEGDGHGHFEPYPKRRLRSSLGT